MFPIVSAFGAGIFPVSLDDPSPQNVEPAVLKAALRHLVGSVSLVTSGEGSQRTGATVTSAYGLSVDPAAMIVAINRDSSSYKTIRRFGHFCVNVLAEGQDDVANRFAGFGGLKGRTGIRVVPGPFAHPVRRFSTMRFFPSTAFWKMKSANSAMRSSSVGWSPLMCVRDGRFSTATAPMARSKGRSPPNRHGLVATGEHSNRGDGHDDR